MVINGDSSMSNISLKCKSYSYMASGRRTKKATNETMYGNGLGKDAQIQVKKIQLNTTHSQKGFR